MAHQLLARMRQVRIMKSNEYYVGSGREDLHVTTATDVGAPDVTNPTPTNTLRSMIVIAVRLASVVLCCSESHTPPCGHVGFVSCHWSHRQFADVNSATVNNIRAVKLFLYGGK